MYNITNIVFFHIFLSDPDYSELKAG